MQRSTLRKQGQAAICEQTVIRLSLLQQITLREWAWALIGELKVTDPSMTTDNTMQGSCSISMEKGSEKLALNKLKTKPGAISSVL
ncbi:TonB-dependent siderophore receptor [Rhodovulum sulfidophilum]|uniref:TonB-dependent siderophore receptor n=1 Tax=Rhodovulum sulfidophilum TaxID=35806 RepID=A0A0D6AYY1_RHOSU|nr:TonB-dependent siderophore receptor [Rhodovulum sulfidophilum]